MANATNLTLTEIRAFLTQLGERLEQPTDLYLLGGGALYLLGNSRATQDIDYVGNDLPDKTDILQNTIRQLAHELRLEVEGVPIDQFMPLPEGASARHRLIGRFGNVTVYVFDPYSIALSKLDRGFESDLEDIVFLIRQNLITLPQLEQYVEQAILRAKEFAMSPTELRKHLAIVKQMHL
ncbi:MAG: DUF6036 family nucleotidyltransferase [Caldilineaceae bacterium]